MEQQAQPSAAQSAPHAPSHSAPHSGPHSPQSRSPRGPGDRPRGEGGRFRRPRRKSCRFCADHVVAIDYKNYSLLRAFVSEKGKIVPSRMTGTCASHQRELTQAIKRARNIALLPFA